MRHVPEERFATPAPLREQVATLFLCDTPAMGPTAKRAASLNIVSDQAASGSRAVCRSRVRLAA
jgi:hypothetical protein